MSEYDFEGEARDLWGGRAITTADCEAALRRAYAAGQEAAKLEAAHEWAQATRGWDVKTIAAMTPGPQASGGGADMDRLVTLAAGHPLWMNHGILSAFQEGTIASDCASLLSALKAQAVAK